MQTKILRWGNSLGLRIPRSFAAEAGVEAGSQVDLSVREGDLVVRAAKRRTCRPERTAWEGYRQEPAW